MWNTTGSNSFSIYDGSTQGSFQIAWDYLERTGELGDAAAASRFLSDTIEIMIRHGQRNRLALSNRGIGLIGDTKLPGRRF